MKREGEERSLQQGLTRRRILLGSWIVATLVLLGEGMASLLRYLKPRTRGKFGGEIVAGVVTEFPPGSITHIQKGKFYLVHLDSGFLAMWHRCTHLGCTVPWKEEDQRFECPCHGSIFNKKGEVLSGPAPRPLDLFPLRIIRGQIVVDTGQVIERTRFDPAQTVSAHLRQEQEKG
ncbi:MAG: Rieske (2Fe-2S) protein [Nitrospinota bacterium]|nr:MAG: Rieske (2Fe-2S) protein [Nitrospinota bacterium]